MEADTDELLVVCREEKGREDMKESLGEDAERLHSDGITHSAPQGVRRRAA